MAKKPSLLQKLAKAFSRDKDTPKRIEGKPGAREFGTTRGRK